MFDVVDISMMPIKKLHAFSVKKAKRERKTYPKIKMFGKFFSFESFFYVCGNNGEKFIISHEKLLC